jgi:glycosyltransferase involved in cell wall biosynthesis
VLAYAQARRDGLEDVELVLAGDLGSPDGRALQAQLAARPIPGVRLAGELDKDGVLDLLSTSLVSVVPSIWYENSPNALLESLACGTPVIASDLGSMRDILAGTGAGWLFPAGDVGRLAKTLRAALDDAGLEERGLRAQQLARTRHHPDHHVDTLLALFESVGVAPRLIADQRRPQTAAGETSRPGRRDSGASTRTELSSLPSGAPVGAPVSRK